MDLTGLPCIDPLDAGARTELLAALNGCVVPGGVLRATIVAGPPVGLAWFGCRGGLAFALEMRDGAPLRLGAAETARAVEALDAAEPVLRAVEQALGIELEPEGLDDSGPPGGARVVRVCSSSLTLCIALPADLALAPSAAPFAPELLGHVPVPVTLTLSGPRVAPVDAADLAVGDLVLLGPGPLVARLDVAPAAPGREQVPGRFDPVSHDFHPAADAGAAQEFPR